MKNNIKTKPLPKKKLPQKEIDFDGKITKSLDIVCQQLFKAFNSEITDFSIKVESFVNGNLEVIEIKVPAHPVKLPGELAKIFLQELFIHFNNERIIYST